MPSTPPSRSGSSFSEIANTEPTLNTKLAESLRRRNPRWRGSDAVVSQSTRVIAGARSAQPDVLVRGAGGPVVIETEFDPAVTLDVDALSRIGKQVVGSTQHVESVVALRYPARLRIVPEGDLASSLESAGDLSWYVRQGGGERDRFPGSGWLIGGVDDLAGTVEALAVSPSRVEKAADRLEEAVASASAIMAREFSHHARSKMAACLHQYDGEQTRRMASAIVANAFLFQIVVAANHGTPCIEEVRQANPYSRLVKGRVLKTWRQILEVNYWPIFAIAHSVMVPAPDGPAEGFCDVLATAAQELAGSGAVEVHDLAGQMFGRLIADRKFLATFYTLPPSAALLAELAVARLDDELDWSDSEAVTGLRIGDLACGTGALLSAAYRRVAARARRAGLDDACLHTAMMERSLIGIDVMPAAAHLSTMILSAAHPAVPFEKCGIHVVPYGQAKNGAVRIGSLDLLADEGTMSLFGREATRLAGLAGSVRSDPGALHLDSGSLDICIMNPPFTRPTNHEIAGVPVPSFAGFETSDENQEQMAKRLKEITADLGEDRAGHGNAGLASNFLDLAHHKLRPGGVLALVVPAQIIAGQSWKGARRLLANHYRDTMVTTLAADESGASAARAFSADTGMAEALIVAVKKPGVGKKRAVSTPAVKATYLTLDERPATIIEAVEIARSFRTAEQQQRRGVGRVTLGGERVGWFAAAPFDPGAAGNPSGIVTPDLVEAATQLRQGRLRLPRVAEEELPMADLESLGARGPVHRDINGAEDKSGKDRGAFDVSPLRRRDDYRQASWPVLWSHDHTRETTMTVLPDSEGTVRDGMTDQALRLWSSHENKRGEEIAGATRLHINLDFQVNSQPVAACLTPIPAIGGRAWPSFAPTGGEVWEKALCAWLNCTLGLIARWWVSGRQQKGRVNLSVTTMGTIPVPDLAGLDRAAVARLAGAFDSWAGAPMRPANEAYDDQNRQSLDEAVLCGALGLPGSILDPLATLRLQWCAEPSVHGGKKTRPQ